MQNICFKLTANSQANKTNHPNTIKKFLLKTNLSDLLGIGRFIHDKELRRCWRLELWRWTDCLIGVGLDVEDLALQHLEAGLVERVTATGSGLKGKKKCCTKTYTFCEIPVKF